MTLYIKKEASQIYSGTLKALSVLVGIKILCFLFFVFFNWLLFVVSLQNWLRISCFKRREKLIRIKKCSSRKKLYGGAEIEKKNLLYIVYTLQLDIQINDFLSKNIPEVPGWTHDEDHAKDQHQAQARHGRP